MIRLRYASLCSGIEAASVAAGPLGWECVFVAEIEPFCCELLAQRYPDAPNLGDMTACDFLDRARACGPIDVLIAGTPCQAFSVAGLRRSLDDDRGNLTLRFLEIANAIDPTWIVWENVPGVLNTEDNAFGCVLAGLVGHPEPLPPAGGAPVGRWCNAGLVTGPPISRTWELHARARHAMDLPPPGHRPPTAGPARPRRKTRQRPCRKGFRLMRKHRWTDAAGKLIRWFRRARPGR